MVSRNQTKKETNMNMLKCKTAFLAMAVLAFAPAFSHGQVVSNLDDLHYWGTGPNRAALVVDWADGNRLAWGFNFSGNITVADMLAAIAAAADSGLYYRGDSATTFGLSIFGIGYRAGSAPFGVTGAVDHTGNPVTPVFVAGFSDTSTSPAGTEAPTTSTLAAPANAGDFYAEGWFDNGFWSFAISSPNNSTDYTVFSAEPYYTFPSLSGPDQWSLTFGLSSITVTDQGWYAFTFNKDFSGSSEPTGAPIAAVPEPGALWLSLLAAALLAGPRLAKTHGIARVHPD